VSIVSIHVSTIHSLIIITPSIGLLLHHPCPLFWRKHLNGQKCFSRRFLRLPLLVSFHGGIKDVSPLLSSANHTPPELLPLQSPINHPGETLSLRFSLLMTNNIIKQDQGIEILTEAIAACTETIDQHKGKLVVKEAPRAVKHMAKLRMDNEEISGNEEEEEDTGMGEVDIEGAGIVE
ncbi:unnamed protein product, partial [Brassica rapa]